MIFLNINLFVIVTIVNYTCHISTCSIKCFEMALMVDVIHHLYALDCLSISAKKREGGCTKKIKIYMKMRGDMEEVLERESHY